METASFTATVSKDDKRHVCTDCGYIVRTPGMLRSVLYPNHIRVVPLTQEELIITVSTIFASYAMNALQHLDSRKTWKDTSIRFIGSASLHGRYSVVATPDAQHPKKNLPAKITSRDMLTVVESL
jgi:hypothetical protein